MGSTNFTEHYDIPLPLGSDKTTPMDYNTSMQAVDTALFTAQGDANDAKQGLVTTNQNVAQNTENISALAGRITTAEGTISSQGTAITNLGTRVDSVEADAQDMICAYNEASATSSHAYAVGDYFIYNDVLYRATQIIGVDDTIVPDSNCTTTNVTSELKNAGGDLSAYQTKIDNGLDTTSKEIVGAINEVNSDLTAEDNLVFKFSKSGTEYGYKDSSDNFVPFGGGDLPHDFGTAVGLLTYSAINPYTAPSDGYAIVNYYTANDYSVVHVGSGSAAISGISGPQMVFIRKGMTLYGTRQGNNTEPYFIPLV